MVVPGTHNAYGPGSTPGAGTKNNMKPKDYATKTKAQLDDNISELESVFQDIHIFGNDGSISEVHLNLLEEQLIAMQKYSSILERRIKLYESN